MDVAPMRREQQLRPTWAPVADSPPEAAFEDPYRGGYAEASSVPPQGVARLGAYDGAADAAAAGAAAAAAWQSHGRGGAQQRPLAGAASVSATLPPQSTQSYALATPPALQPTLQPVWEHPAGMAAPAPKPRSLVPRGGPGSPGPQRRTGSPRALSPSGSTSHLARAGSPPRPTSPRQRMSDVKLQWNPAPLSPRPVVPRSPSPRDDVRSSLLTACSSPRLGWRGEARASDECLAWLRTCQTDSYVEGRVEVMIGNNAKRASPEFRFAQQQLKNPSYRNATKSATSLARRAKPPSWH
eukprot:TRINITY_DN64608_c0_g1_i1.p1 TRINITY_DN64608_c0_g1~~TRINITY_DN64608_c0_g1_i1.p1  ORF type:complete len:344 (-),score=51.35 TRINITY_DN64608_c0_g1_i1:78-968(-)